MCRYIFCIVKALAFNNFTIQLYIHRSFDDTYTRKRIKDIKSKIKHINLKTNLKIVFSFDSTISNYYISDKNILNANQEILRKILIEINLYLL